MTPRQLVEETAALLGFCAPAGRLDVATDYVVEAVRRGDPFLEILPILEAFLKEPCKPVRNVLEEHLAGDAE